MRRIIVLTMLLVSCLNASADSLRVKIIDGDSNPVQNAYLNINRLTVATTDKNGIGYLEKEMLHVNDTIGASCIGCVDAEIIYDAALQNEDHCVLVLPEDIYYIDEVVIVPDAGNFFRNSTNILSPVTCDCVMNADISLTYDHPENIISIDGRLELENRKFTGKPKHAWNNWYSKKYEFTSAGDTTGIGKIVYFHTVGGVVLMNWAFYLVLNEGKNVDYTYLGTKNGNKLFRLSYSEFNPYRKIINPLSYQLILTVDSDNKNIKAVELTSRAITSYSGDDRIEEIYITSDIELFNSSASRKPFLTTKNMNATYHYANGSTANVIFSNEVVEDSR